MSIRMNFSQTFFLKYCCYPPPGRELPEHAGDAASNSDFLADLKKYFGDDFLQEIHGKFVVDLGCGRGYQVVGAILNGAKYAIGIDMCPIFKEAENYAMEAGISDRLKFSSSSIKSLDNGSIDVVFSQNSFEHFAEPKNLMTDVYDVLKRGGKFFITFGPPWLHPYGVHMFFMIKIPWAHLIFSEKTILSVRKLYRQDNAMTFGEVEGGLNKMTIKKFKKYVELSGFHLQSFTLTPLKGLRFLIKIPYICEFFTSQVSAVLIKP